MLNIMIIICLIGLLTILGFVNYYFLTSPLDIAVKQKQSEYIQKITAEREWQRLFKKHGYPAAVIIKDGQPPFYFDKEGRKCLFQ